MKLPLFRHLWIGCLLVCFAPASPAQQPPPATVTASLTMLALVDQPITDLSFRAGARLVPFRAPSFTRSTTYQYVGPATVTFTRMQDNAGVKQPVDVNTVTLPPGGGRVLVVIAGAVPTYSMGAVSDAPETLPPGKARLFNATPVKLSLLCNQETTVELKPFDTQLVGSKGGDLAVRVSRPDKDGNWESVSSGIYQLPGDRRLELFMVVSNSPRFIFQTAVQIYPLVEKPPAGGSGG